MAQDIVCIGEPAVPIFVAPTIPVQLTDEDLDCGAGPLPIPCAESPIPLVTEWFLADQLVQELKIEARPIDSMSEYVYMSVWAEYATPSVDWHTLWVHDSRDAMAKAIEDDELTAIYGATGLIPGAMHRFRVAWCKQGTDNIGCNCYAESTGFLDANNDDIPDARPTAFPSPPVASPFTPEIEDRFNRPATNPKRNRGLNTLKLGDGLGGGDVWLDDQIAGAFPVSNGSYIYVNDNGKSFAAIPTGTFMQHDRILPHPHSFTEIQFRPHCSTFEPSPPADTLCDAQGVDPVDYRIDVRTRGTLAADLPWSYSAQVLYEPNHTATPEDPGGPEPDPKVFIRREAGPLGTSLRDDVGGSGLKVEGSPAWSAALGEGCYVNDTAAIVQAGDIADLKNGTTIILRIEAVDSGSFSVDLEAFLGWGCTASGCPNRCIWKVNDAAVADGHALHGTKDHQASFFVHHWDALIEAFRAGSTQ